MMNNPTVKTMDIKSFIEQIKNNIMEKGLLEQGNKIIVGLSGGADSVCLMKVLLELKDEFNLTLFAVHVNHGLRGLEADNDQSYVEELCKDWGIPLKTYSVNIKALGKKLGISKKKPAG